jgi:hypothetical protein
MHSWVGGAHTSTPRAHRRSCKILFEQNEPCFINIRKGLAQMRSLSCDRCTYCFAPSRLAAVLELPQQIVDRLPCVGVVVFDDIRVTVSNPQNAQAVYAQLHLHCPEALDNCEHSTSSWSFADRFVYLFYRNDLPDVWLLRTR